MVTATLASIVGFCLIVAAMTAVFFSPYRRWLGFMIAGMIFWSLLEVVRFSVQKVFDMPMTYSYLTAVMVAMVAVTFILLREDSRAQKALANRQYIEHTPVYEDE
ncbi:ciprofloxacin tolerance protein AciT [Acinetobacter stercoris]|uniref:Uncharacterized protein n=1 Tax=Acinetobacter stercoris TaxID=2126983 RepID=A0A2U3MUX0_9GAMM|nr:MULTISPECIES: ciprofloxacin tolerance protein AciT [Acinetobacter]SPL69194.1 hypothetical protein KPC_0372 [Acinetobacter stercoris]